MKYEEYKDSEVEWIGEVPNHWEVRKIKTLSIVKRGASPRPIENPKYFDENGEYAWVRIADVSNSERYLEATTQKLSKLGASLSVKREPGDIFISIAGTVGKPIITHIKCCIHDGFVWFPYLKQNSEFLYYVFMSGQPYLGLGKMGTQLNLNTETIGDIKIPIPSFHEQQAIVAYLDKKCEEINRVIDVQKKKIDLLNELKQTIITNAVTKGLNPNAPMKDSGVEWIGEIPAHWDVMKLKYSFKNLDYMREPISAEKRERINPIYDYYGASGVIDKIDNYNVDDTVLLIGEDGANLVMRNLPLIYKATGKFWVNNHAHILKPQKGNSYDYMAYLLEMVDYTTSITGSAQPKLSQENLGHILLCVPPFSEQQTIASHLDEECAKIDLQISKANRRIELLNELKQSIITEAVTGKIKVC